MKTQTRVKLSKNQIKWKRAIAYILIIVGIITYMYYLLPILNFSFFVSIDNVKMHMSNDTAVIHSENYIRHRQPLIADASNIDQM
jgi:hypothetical protein